jgi:hypothetical protein
VKACVPTTPRLRRVASVVVGVVVLMFETMPGGKAGGSSGRMAKAFS